VTDQAVMELIPQLGVRAACEAVGAAQAGYYRRHRQSPAPARPEPIPHSQRRQPRALSTAEQQVILDVLHSDRFADLAPAQVWATLLDEGVYLGSESTFYRLLRQAGEVRERRRQATHPAKVKPELATQTQFPELVSDNLRQAVKRTHNCGITTEIVAEQELDDKRLAELTEVVRASPSGAHTDRGFCMNLDGVLERRYPGVQLIIARDKSGRPERSPGHFSR
jgi:hypothetical protein